MTDGSKLIADSSPGPSMLNLKVDTTGSFVTAGVCGDLGSSDVESFADALHEHAAGEGAKLAIDLAALESIDSTGLSALINLVTRARLSQGRVILVAPTPLVSGVLNVTRLDAWFEICDTLDEAARRFADG